MDVNNVDFTDRYGVIFTSPDEELGQTDAPFATAQQAIEWAAKHLGRTVEGVQLAEGEAGILVGELVTPEKANSIPITHANIDRCSINTDGSYREQLDYVATVRLRAARALTTDAAA